MPLAQTPLHRLRTRAQSLAAAHPAQPPCALAQRRLSASARQRQRQRQRRGWGRRERRDGCGQPRARAVRAVPEAPRGPRDGPAPELGRDPQPRERGLLAVRGDAAGAQGRRVGGGVQAQVLARVGQVEEGWYLVEGGVHEVSASRIMPQSSLSVHRLTRSFNRLLYRVWHRCHSSCTSDEAWTKYVQNANVSMWR